MDKLKALFAVFRQGERVANPEEWKNGQITVGVLVSLISAIVMLCKVFGYEIPITAEQEAAIASVIIFIVGLFNPIATIVSSRKVGLQSKDGDTNDTSGTSDNIMG